MGFCGMVLTGTGHHWWKEEEMAVLQKKRRSSEDEEPFLLYNDMIRGVFTYLRDHFKGRYIVFLAATAGHPNCQVCRDVWTNSCEVIALQIFLSTAEHRQKHTLSPDLYCLVFDGLTEIDTPKRSNNRSWPNF